MCRFVIVPNSVRDAINKRLDAALEEHPAATKDRERFFQELLSYFDEHGYIPQFDLVPPDVEAPATTEDAP